MDPIPQMNGIKIAKLSLGRRGDESGGEFREDGFEKRV